MVLTAPDEFDWQSIERDCGLEFTHGHRDRLSAAVSQYLMDLSFEMSKPSSKEVDERLKAIGSHSRGLAKALSTKDSASEEAVNSVWPWSRTIDPGNFKAFLWELSTLAKRQQLLKSRVGRRRHAAISVFALEVRAIWRDAGGAGIGCYWYEAKGRYAGRLLDLINSLITQVPDSELPKARMIYDIVTS